MHIKREIVIAAWFFLFVLFAGGSRAENYIQEEELPLKGASDAGYRTPRAGEGLRAEVFGRAIEVQPRNRRRTTSWDIGIEYTPGLDDAILGMGYLYFWRHPDDELLQRGVVTIIYNDLLWARKINRASGLEIIFTFQNLTPPGAQAELVDGRSVHDQELRWGYVRAGAGLGYRRQIAAGNQDNMFSLDFLLEPAYFYFSKGPDTAADFRVPRDTPELRAHVQMRWDEIERNLLELPHRGFAAGGDLISGMRSHWENWGLNGEESGEQGREYLSASAYFFSAGGIPGIDSERHRIIGSLHGGWGVDVDRFSATRLGGGQNTIGEEYESTSGPILPGSARGEFFPRHYLVAFGEYRWEPVFFAYLGFNASVARLDRWRDAGTEIVNRTDTFTSAGIRLTSGFLYNSRLQFAYNYGFSVIRSGERGAHELALHISKTF